MAIKYRRGSEDGEYTSPPNRYAVPRRLGPSNPKQRIMIIYLGAAFVLLMVLLYHFVSRQQTKRWLPVRNGDAVIVGKEIEETAGGGDTRYWLTVKVLTPAAIPSEAAYVLEDRADRDAVIGPREFIERVETSRADWEAVEEGARLRVAYQINMQRERISVLSLYLDALDGGRSGEPSTSPPDG